MIVNGSHTLTITTKLSILDACSGSCHVSERLLSIKLANCILLYCNLVFRVLKTSYPSQELHVQRYQ